MPIDKSNTAAGFAILLVFGLSHAALADQPADKCQYNLFNPVPLDDLRGMDTDRPNKTNTPHTIDAGHLQVETGFFDYVYDRDRAGGDNARIETADLGQFNFRLGVLNNLELNVVANTWDFLRDTDYAAGQSVRQNGVGDTIVGAKLNLWGNDGADGTWASALGIQPQFKIPTARQAIGNGHAELDVGVPFLINLPADTHLGLQPTISWQRSTDNTADVTGWQNSASVDRVFFDKYDIYVEYWSQVTTERHQKSQQTLDVGVTIPTSDNVVWDTGLNFGLNHASSTFEWLAGVSIRF